MKKTELLALGATIGGLVLALLARSKRLRKREMRGVALASVVLEERNHTCEVAFKDNPIRTGRGAVIIWSVDNNCTSEQTFSLTNFSPSNPLKQTPAARPVPAGRTRMFTATVHPHADLREYKYAIRLNGVLQQDPEIIIEY